MEKQIQITAHQLALKFSMDADIPSRFKNRKQNSSQTSIAEIRFQENVKGWAMLIKNLLQKTEENQAWRFVTLNPSVENDLKGSAYAKDLNDFTEYLILRRDVEQCGPTELGYLSMLHTEFHREINRIINNL